MVHIVDNQMCIAIELGHTPCVDVYGLEDTDAEDEEEGEPLPSGSAVESSLPDKARSTQYKTTEGPLEGSPSITFTAPILKVHSLLTASICLWLNTMNTPMDKLQK